MVQARGEKPLSDLSAVVATGREDFGTVTAHLRLIPVTPSPLLQTPPARAGRERSEQMKPQVLWAWVFPSIYAVLLQNMQVKFCQTLLSCFILITFLFCWPFFWFWGLLNLLVKLMRFQLLG